MAAKSQKKFNLSGNSYPAYNSRLAKELQGVFSSSSREFIEDGAAPENEAIKTARIPEREQIIMEKTESTEKTIDILLIEDNGGDVRLMQEAFRQSKIRCNMSVANDGVEAMSFLSRQGDHQNAPRPDLILLDLNLPKKDGREVLAEIKKNDQLKRIPVVVLTTSRAEQDVLISYNLHANCYITKPTGFQQLVEVVKAIKDFWLARVKLPPK